MHVRVLGEGGGELGELGIVFSAGDVGAEFGALWDGRRGVSG